MGYEALPRYRAAMWKSDLQAVIRSACHAAKMKFTCTVLRSRVGTSYNRGAMDCTTVELDDRLAGRAPGRNTATRSFSIIACKVQNNSHPVELVAKTSASNDAEDDDAQMEVMDRH